MKAGESSMASKNSMSSFSSLDSPSGVPSAPSEDQHREKLLYNICIKLSVAF